MNITDHIALVSALIAIIALFWQIRQSNKQARLQNFTSYTERYQNIVLNLPLDIESEKFDLQKLEKDEFEKTVRWLRAYFDLCSEEYYLCREKLIDKNVWKTWKSGMVVVFNRPAYKQAWEVIQRNDYFSSEFEQFVKSLQENYELVNADYRA